MVVTKQETINLVKPQLSKFSRIVLEKRYLEKDSEGKVIETPEEMFLRVARHIAQADLLYDNQANIDEIIAEFYTVLANLEFIPNSPTLMNAGRELGQLSACFVLPIDDSMESIFNTLKYTALIHKSGGGTGFSFSRLRPKNDIVKSTTGISSGPISFMQVYNAATEAIKQGGTRRGANMGILRVDHPDIMEFITCKNDNESLNNFNISVGITEEFMEAVERDIEFPLRNPRTKEIVRKVSAKEIFDKIIDQAWKNGEPGIVFLDRINEANPTPEIGEIESTNPCGEQPLLPYESCNLGSINLSKFVKDNDVDWTKLKRVVRTAVHFLDNVIDMNKFPIKEIEYMTKQNRKIGLGVMGFADMLILLGIPYNSKLALKFADKLMEFIYKSARETSIELAQKRGPFPNFSKSIYKDGVPIRNATLTTIAPTGTISIIANASSGIEPIFAVVYTRKNILDNQEFYEVNPYFEKIAIERNFYSNELIEKIAKTGSIHDMDEIPVDVRRLFVTAHDILPEDHVRMQAVFQKHVDNAVSKTVNFPYNATRDDVKKVYLLAYQLGCKGVTIYRDKSRDKQVLNIGENNQNKDTHRKPRFRPNITQGMTLRINTGCGRMYVTLNEDEQGLCELFTQLGKSGGCTASQSEAIARLISLALRSGINPEDIVGQLKGIRCPTPNGIGESSILSCADGIAKAIETYLRETRTPNLFSKEKKSIDNNTKRDFIGSCPACPECGNILEFKEGCALCSNCGYSKCW
jgi:ribonucleoside-diphosphate reductase alpha chain